MLASALPVSIKALFLLIVPLTSPSTVSLKPSPSVSKKLSAIPSPLASVPPASTTSGTPSLSESKSFASGIPSPSVSGFVMLFPFVAPVT